MSDYTQTTFFAPKDALSSGDPLKVIYGAEVDPEFSAISVAIATKYDSTDLASQAQAEAEAASTVLLTPVNLAHWSDYNAGIVGDLQALASPGADRILFWDDSAGAAAALATTEGVQISGTDLKLDVNTLTADASPVGSTDYVVTYDASAGTHKKVLLDNLGFSTTGATYDYKIKPASTTRTSTTTLAADPDLVTASLATGKYLIQVYGAWGFNAGTQGVKCDFSGGSATISTSTTFAAALQYIGPDQSDNNTHSRHAYPSGGGGVGFNSVTGATTVPFVVNCMLEVTGAGTVAFSWAQNTSSATGTKLDTASMVVTKVA